MSQVTLSTRSDGNEEDQGQVHSQKLSLRTWSWVPAEALEAGSPGEILWDFSLTVASFCNPLLDVSESDGDGVDGVRCTVWKLSFCTTSSAE